MTGLQYLTEVSETAKPIGKFFRVIAETGLSLSKSRRPLMSKAERHIRRNYPGADSYTFIREPRLIEGVWEVFVQAYRR